MTITLAAVYTPIGLQGGLTGSLFREFAFTLSGAVIISGVVALTLSPMMASKMLKPGNAKQRTCRKDCPGFQSGSEPLRPDARRHPRLPSGGLHGMDRGEAADHTHVHMSPCELAPTEDQGVIFGIIDAAANSTLDQTQPVMPLPSTGFFSAIAGEQILPSR